MKRIDLTVNNLREALTRLSYAFFENGDYNLNIVGIRTNDIEANSFNDFIAVAYKERGQWQLETYEATTDPGVYWRKHPMNRLGTAVLATGQHRRCYQLGRHQGKYEALTQAEMLPVYRDSNKDSIIDADGAIDIGFHGINIHRASANWQSKQVHKWSAGCQVFANPNNFDYFIELCKKSTRLYGSRITYTLIEEKDLV